MRGQARGLIRESNLARYLMVHLISAIPILFLVTALAFSLTARGLAYLITAPPFWLAIGLVLLFGTRWRLLPLVLFTTRVLVLPSLIPGDSNAINIDHILLRPGRGGAWATTSWAEMRD